MVHVRRLRGRLSAGVAEAGEQQRQIGQIDAPVAVQVAIGPRRAEVCGKVREELREIGQVGVSVGVEVTEAILRLEFQRWLIAAPQLF